MSTPTRSATVPVARPQKGPSTIPDNMIGIVPREILTVPRGIPKKRVSTMAVAARRLAVIRFLVVLMVITSSQLDIAYYTTTCIPQTSKIRSPWKQLSLQFSEQKSGLPPYPDLARTFVDATRC